MKFPVDVPLSPGLAAWLRGHGHDAIHASEVSLRSASDVQILTEAKQQSRTIVTADLDYPRLLAQAHATSPSLILFRGGNWSDADIVMRIDEVLRALTPADLHQSILVVDRDRVRRRRLPIETD